MSATLKRLAPFVLVLVVGMGLGWVAKNGGRSKGGAEVPGSVVRIDPTQPIHFTRIHKTDHPGYRLQPFHVRAEGKSELVAPRPAEDEAHWLITANGGAVIIAATEAP